jgi:hypothetical protein
MGASTQTTAKGTINIHRQNSEMKRHMSCNLVLAAAASRLKYAPEPQGDRMVRRPLLKSTRRFWGRGEKPRFCVPGTNNKRATLVTDIQQQIRRRMKKYIPQDPVEIRPEQISYPTLGGFSFQRSRRASYGPGRRLRGWLTGINSLI